MRKHNWQWIYSIFVSYNNIVYYIVSEGIQANTQLPSVKKSTLKYLEKRRGGKKVPIKLSYRKLVPLFSCVCDLAYNIKTTKQSSNTFKNRVIKKHKSGNGSACWINATLKRLKGKLCFTTFYRSFCSFFFNLSGPDVPQWFCKSSIPTSFTLVSQ